MRPEDLKLKEEKNKGGKISSRDRGKKPKEGNNQLSECQKILGAWGTKLKGWRKTED